MIGRVKNVMEITRSRALKNLIVWILLLSVRSTSAQEKVCQDEHFDYCSTLANQTACDLCAAFGMVVDDLCSPFLEACPRSCHPCQTEGARHCERGEDEKLDYCSKLADQNVCTLCENFGSFPVTARVCDPFLASCPLTCNRCDQNFPHVRLVNGYSSKEGRVEVFVDGEWGTVCADDWDFKDARVLCRSLGLPDALGITSLSEFGQSSKPMLVNSTKCNGTESSIFECLANDTATKSCSSADNEAGVRCSDCKDVKEECSYWASEGACQSYPEIALPNCQASCNECIMRSLNETGVSPSNETDCVTGHCFVDENNNTKCVPAMEMCLSFDWYEGLICTPTPNRQRDSFIKCMTFKERSPSELEARDIAQVLKNGLGGMEYTDYRKIHDDMEAVLSVLETAVNNMNELRYQHILDRQNAATVLLVFETNMSRIEEGAFRGLNNLKTLWITETTVENITKGVFSGLEKLQYMNIRVNKIAYVENGSFAHSPNLLFLELLENRLSKIEPGAFSGLSNLRQLNLRYNYISYIGPNVFDGLGNLEFLYLDYNRIAHISPGAFSDLRNLLIVNLSSNSLRHLGGGMFTGLGSLEYLDLTNNPIYQIEPFVFTSLVSLRFLFLLNTGLEIIEQHALAGLDAVEKLITSDRRLCCQLEGNDNFICDGYSQPHPLDTCSRLFPNWALRIAGWVMGLSALVGNAIVLFLRVQEGKDLRTSKVQNTLIGSLAMADILMGVYMIIITSADVFYGDGFYLSASYWRNSHICRFAGFLGFLSSEASVFTLTLITIDRFICIMFPFSKFKMGRTCSKLLVGLVWGLTVLLSLGLAIISFYRPDVYGLSNVCLGLPLHVETESTGFLDIRGKFYFEFQVSYVITSTITRPSSWFSIVFFIGINLISFVFIFVCYVLMFVKSKRSMARVKNNQQQEREAKLARRMAMIVATDLVCWMPVIIMGILSQTRMVTLPPSLYAWTVILIVPINSSINPLLYTFILYVDARKGKKPSKKDRKAPVNIVKPAKKSSTHSISDKTGKSPSTDLSLEVMSRT